ncbi:hypothetical protein M1L60_19460 [Actinoplanes sp. TRM 88003]|uniref:Secreted protein n=1 Tax=Paractinoplanes aksuensis TaxID=2939490 RepID=A0ABT1DPK5_9ACTN|nr:hypothetical protein [Actinoplanes aksuensis]MCO8272776.1 hypothetical protein [Actinoplanes aksuensis]
MGDLLINLLASVIAGTAVWLAGFGLRRRKLGRERAFFGLTDGASCLLVVSRHASSTRESSVHRRDVAALVELATIARECGAHADRVGENQPTGEIGRLTEFCVGGPGGASPRSATHVRTILRGVTYEVFDDEQRRMSFTVGATRYEAGPEASHVLLARFWGPGGGRPVFFIGGLTAGSNLAGARYLAQHHVELARQYGADRPFALVLRIVEPNAYGTDFTELVADVSTAAFRPLPQPPGLTTGEVGSEDQPLPQPPGLTTGEVEGEDRPGPQPLGRTAGEVGNEERPGASVDRLDG